MSNWLKACLFVFGFTAAAQADEVAPTPLPPTTTLQLLSDIGPPSDREPAGQARHLFDAAQSLRLAGRIEAANTLHTEAQQLLKPQLDGLEAKREQQQRLDEEIQAIERRLGCPASVVVKFQVCSLTSDQGATVLPPLEERGGPFSSFWLSELKEMIKKKVIRIEIEPSMYVQSGRKGSLMSGGEFPIMQVTGEDHKIEYKEFGTRVEANPQCLGANQVHLDLIVEQSDRDFSSTVKVAGHEIPGLRVQRINTQIDAKIGETYFLRYPDHEERVKFCIIKIEKAAPLSPPE